MSCIIYTLSDPVTNEVRYVGKADRLGERLRKHLRESAEKCTNHRTKWIASLTQRGLLPVIEPLEVVDGDWQEAEKFYINYFTFLGVRLTNSNGGGMGGCDPRPEVRAKIAEWHRTKKVVSEESRRKMSEAKRGKKQTPEHIEKVRQANLGKKRSLETRAKMSAWQVGRKMPPCSDEHREKLRKAGLGRKMSPEAIAKTASFWRGRKHTEESRRKMSASKVGITLTPEHREKIRVGGLGRRPTEETRQKLRKAWTSERRARMAAQVADMNRNSTKKEGSIEPSFTDVR